MCIISELNWYLNVVAGFDHYHSALTVLNLRLKYVWPGQLALFTSRSGVFILPAYKDAFIPLYSGNPTCERAAWRHLSIESHYSLGLCIKSQYIFLKFRITGLKVGGALTHSLSVSTYTTVRLFSALFLNDRSKLAPSRWSLKRCHIPACLKAPVSTASTTVVLDQMRMRCVSIFVKDYYAWFKKRLHVAADGYCC